MKPIYTYVLLIVVGILLGAGVCHNYYVKIAPDVQRDTTYIYEKVPYSRLDLGKMAVQLSVPEVDVPKLTFLNVEKIDTVYKDNVMYITYPRENYYTSVKDVEIWYSGIDSTIDSLNVVVKNATISKTETTTQLVRHTNRLRLGIDANYYSTPFIPIYLEYERMLHRNIGINARFFYDMNTRLYGVGGGVYVQIGW